VLVLIILQKNIPSHKPCETGSKTTGIFHIFFS